MKKTSLNSKQRLTLGVGAIGAAALMAMGGVFAAFTGTVSAGPQSIGTGVLNLALDPAAGSSLTSFTQSVTGMVPGDVNNRFVTLRNSGTVASASTTLTVTDTPGTTKLATDATNGLRIRVDQCSVAWTLPAGTCGGTTTTVVTEQGLAALGTARAMTGVALTPGQTAFLRVTHSLPTAADNTFEGLTETLTFKFDATAVAGQAY